MCLDICVMIYIHHYGILHSIFTALKILCSTYSFLSPLTPGSQLSFYFIILPFLKCHVVRIIQEVGFSDWLLSLSNTDLSFHCVILWPNSSFLFSAK